MGLPPRRKGCIETMRQYIFSRILQVIPVLLLVSIIVFFIMHALPGDPAQLMLAGAEGGAVTPERLAELRTQMGLDDPLAVQYFRFLGGAIHGDFGNSIRLRAPVMELIMDRFGSTMLLSLVGLGFSILIGLAFGILAALKQNSWIDTLSMVFSYIGVSMPIFWLGLLLILVFSFELGWFDPAGGTGFKSLVLPGFTLGFASAGIVSRLTRSSLIEVLNEDYIRTARAKGLSESLVIIRHALKNSMIPVITMVGLQFGGMLAGAVVTETVFSRPGLGRLIVSAILWKDYPLVQGSVMVLALIYVTVNLLVDISYAWLDPRIHYGEQS
jgi:peptide/nickel transport system permease protein